MAIIPTKVPRYKPAKDVIIDWNNFRKGLNTLLKETEISQDELAEADNIILIGKGVPTKRWGTESYFYASDTATDSVRAVKGLYQSDGTNQLLSITDEGVLTRKSNASYAAISGVSWPSGSQIDMAQLEDNMYIVSDLRELVRYANPTLTAFATLAIPTNTFATQISGVSGTNTYSYRVSSVSEIGETLAADPYIVANQPQDLSDGSVLVSWTGVSAASGVLRGYNIYGRVAGDERFVGSVDSTSTNFIDDGSATPAEFGFPPTADSTGGFKAKYVERFQDRLIYAGLDNEPTKVLISGRAPNHEITHWSYGGGFIKIEPDAGDDITGLAVFGNAIIVFKERSVWEVTLSTTQVGNYTVLTPSSKLITKSHGCISGKSIVSVENDVFFLSRQGVYALGYEPNIFNVLRTNEISAKIRPFFDGLTTAQKQKAIAFYHKFHYGIAFPGKDQTMVYDRERLAWTGPWDRDSNVYEVYYDSSNDEHLLYGSDSGPTIVEYKENKLSDDGVAFDTVLRTKKDDYGDWTLFKNIMDVWMLFRNVRGEVGVDIRIQTRDGQVTTVKSFDIGAIAGNAGWGADVWANTLWGDSEESGGGSDIDEVYRQAILNKASRNIQFIIKTTNVNDQYELLQVRSTATPMGKGFIASSERI